MATATHDGTAIADDGPEAEPAQFLLVSLQLNHVVASVHWDDVRDLRSRSSSSAVCVCVHC